MQRTLQAGVPAGTWPESSPESPRVDTASAASDPQAILRTLSPRQVEVLRLMADGYHTKAMAGMMGISSKTVEFHRGELYRKLKLRVNCEALLARFAVAAGVVSACLMAALADISPDTTVEIRREAGGPSPVQVRVTGGLDQQYWIERSDDGGRTWEEYIRVYPDQWYWISVRPTNSLFRAKNMLP